MQPLTQFPWLRHYDSFVPHQLPLAACSLIDQFEQTAAAMPEAPAIHHFDRTIPFGELNGWAERFAARLSRWGIASGDRVAVWMQNDPEFLVAVYGAWKRGCIAVPLSAMFKQKEMEYHLRDSGARVLVAIRGAFEQHAAPVLGSTAVEQTLFVDELLDSLASEQPRPDQRVPASPDAIAYLVYTSGTTGDPKGAMCLHRNIGFNTEVFRTWMRVTPADRILGIAPLFHITGLVAQISLSALSGAPLILYHRFDPGRTIEMIERWRPTLSLGAITAYIALMNDPAAPHADFSSMVKVFTGGAPVAPAVAAQFEARCGAYIHNTYGLTESNSPSHITPLNQRGPVDPNYGALAIGLPIPNCEAKIVDAADPSRDLPAGETGENALRGPMIFPGYWNKPEATAKAFHNGWFLTGDIAMMDPEGWFYIVDRKKDMIVASGYKVWPRDVEDVLYQHPAVKEAAVIGVPDEYRGETVKAFVALSAEWIGRVAPEDLIAHCRERMAAYKYPRQVEFVPEIPKTATGKFLRRSLRSQ
ncbi:MAG: long-chain fatty acid--CoA ligase [Acidobacteria bacterium]|nr:long-chain fatty acid--CoA ligase [Acidobacteriota bacterium]